MGSPLGEVAAAVDLVNQAVKLYDIAKCPVQEPVEQWNELGDTLKGFESTLEVLNDLGHHVRSLGIDRSQLPGNSRYKAQFQQSTQLAEDCRKYLEDNSQHRHKQGKLANIRFAKRSQVKVDHLHKRFLRHNSQINLIISSINLYISGQTQTRLIERYVPRYEPERADTLFEVEPLNVPTSLSRDLRKCARSKFNPLETAPVVECVQTAVAHHNRAKAGLGTGISASTSSSEPQALINLVLDLMISAWLIQVIQGRLQQPQPTRRGVQQSSQDGKWGTIAVELEKEHRQLLFRHSLQKFETDEDVIESMINAWDETPIFLWTDQNSILSRQQVQKVIVDPNWHKILSTMVYDPDIDSKYVLDVYRVNESRLILVNGQLSQREISLDELELRPLYAFPTDGPKAKRYVVTVGTKGGAIPPKAYTFDHKRELQELLQAVTGYDMRFVDPNIGATPHDSGFLKEETKMLIGRVEVWSFNPLKKIVEESDGQQSAASARSVSTDSDDLQRRMSNFSVGSGPKSPTLMGKLGRKTTFSAAKSIKHKGKQGWVLDEPKPPCIVVFVEGEGSLSFLYIEMDRASFINKKRCDCKHDNNQCYVVVLDSSAGLNVKKYDSDNLAALGTYQKEGDAGIVQNINQISIKFASPERRLAFQTRFKAIDAIYRKKLKDHQDALLGRKVVVAEDDEEQ